MYISSLRFVVSTRLLLICLLCNYSLSSFSLLIPFSIMTYQTRMAGNLMRILICIFSSSSWYYNLSVEAYSTGAPVDTNPDICNTMTPNHQAEATTVRSPYHITVEGQQYTPGQPLGSKYTWVLLSGIIKLEKENIFMYQTLFLFPDNFHLSTGTLAHFSPIHRCSCQKMKDISHSVFSTQFPVWI